MFMIKARQCGNDAVKLRYNEGRNDNFYHQTMGELC